MSNRVRRQHTVSKFYLNGFADDAGRIRRVSLPGAPAPVLSTGDASVIKDFYTVTLPDGSLSDFFERAFSKIESPAAEALRLILSGTWPIQGEHRKSFATWIALQHLRAEQIRQNQKNHNAEMIRLLVGVSGKEALRSRIQEAEGRVVGDEELDIEWRDLTKPGGPDMAADAIDHIRLLMDLLPGTAAYLNDCQWTLFKFNRRSIITSDHPVSLAVAPDYPAWQGVGIFTADLFLVPLSRRHALTIQPKNLREGMEIPDFTVSGSTKIAQSINQETAMGARKYIYQHPEESPLQGIRLPQPVMRDRPGMSNTDGLIREEGLFSGIPEASLRAMSETSPPGDRENGMTIDDLPWPIPGRRRPGADE
ncbi:DUF4238 domain-containing protein [Streptomyces sp. TRM64462]|uniref:DUF4238 domain-containing protein n=1 Tax=Streptomyces sp. TRM64462 TaxID=2741726 RepID=UPI0015861736|nr:DUF4238 domain-containing protein [Streptomyces sp. TRM64462]